MNEQTVIVLKPVSKNLNTLKRLMSQMKHNYLKLKKLKALHIKPYGI